MNLFEKLFAVLGTIYPLSDDLKKALSLRLKIGHYKRKQVLLNEGEVADHVYFINKGLLRAYHREDGEETTSWFMKEDDVMVSIYSFFTRKPGDEIIEVVEDCELVYFDYETLQFIYKNFIEFNIIGRLLTEKYYVLSEERAMVLRKTSMTDRYQHMLDNYPDLLNRVKVKHLASYLGMKEETLSRVRKKRKQ